jgi:hypothetical protein
LGEATNHLTPAGKILSGETLWKADKPTEGSAPSKEGCRVGIGGEEHLMLLNERRQRDVSQTNRLNSRRYRRLRRAVKLERMIKGTSGI